MTFDELCEEYAKTDSFMEPQIEWSAWFEIYTSDGIVSFMAEGAPEMFVSGPLLNSPANYGHALKYTTVSNSDEIYDISFVEGYGARLSAPGYLDCTEWVVFDTEQKAIDYLAETYLN